MVCINIFSGSPKNQFLRTLIATSFLILADIVYYFFTGGVLAGTKFYKGEFPLMAYIAIWLTLGAVFGVVEFRFEDPVEIVEVEVENYEPEGMFKGQLISDSAFFGMIIGLIVFTVLTTWLYYINGSPTIALMNLCFGIVECTFASMFTHIIAHNHNLYG